MDDIQFKEQVAKRVKQYRNFPGYKGKTDLELSRIAEQKVRIENLIDDLEIVGQFDDPDEKKRGKELATKYFSDYTFEFISDKNTLKQLIYLEIVNERLQKMLNEFYTDSRAVPTQMMEALHKNVIQITTLKESLGLTKDTGDEDKSDAMKALDTLKKKFKKWRAENNGSRTIICPECSKLVLLKIRTDAWEAQKHPFFIDRILANKALIDLYRKNRLTKRELADILMTSEDYIDWMISKIAPITSISDLNALYDEKTSTSEQTENDAPSGTTT